MFYQWPIKSISWILLLFLIACSTIAAAQGNYEWYRELKQHQAAVTAVAIRAEDNVVFSGSNDGQIIAWDLTSGRLKFTLEGHQQKITHLDFNPSGQLMASASYDGSIRIWDLATHKLKHQFEVVNKGAYGEVKGNEPTFVVFAPSGDQVYFGGYNGNISVGDWQQQKQWSIFNDAKFGITCGLMATEQKKLYWSTGEQIYIYDLKQKKIIAQIAQTEEFNDYTCEIALSPNTAQLAAWTYGGEILFSEKNHPNIAKKFKATTAKGSSNIAFSFDGQYLISGNKGNQVLLWDLKQEKVLQVLEKHQKAVTCFTFSKDDEYIASGGNDQAVHIWKRKKPKAQADKKLSEVNGRPVELQKQVKIKSSEVEISFWDHQRVDGDIISVYLNDKLILKEHQLKARKHKLMVTIPPGKNYLTIYAHNEGKISPNTIAIQILDQGNRLFYTLKSSMETNAAIELWAD